MLVICQYLFQAVGVYFPPVADGQFVQYFVLNIAHIPLYQRGIAGRFCKNTVWSSRHHGLVGLRVALGVLSSSCVRFHAFWFWNRS